MVNRTASSKMMCRGMYMCMCLYLPCVCSRN